MPSRGLGAGLGAPPTPPPFPHSDSTHARAPNTARTHRRTRRSATHFHAQKQASTGHARAHTHTHDAHRTPAGHARTPNANHRRSSADCPPVCWPPTHLLAHGRALLGGRSFSSLVRTARSRILRLSIIVFLAHTRQHRTPHTTLTYILRRRGSLRTSTSGAIKRPNLCIPSTHTASRGNRHERRRPHKTRVRMGSRTCNATHLPRTPRTHAHHTHRLAHHTHPTPKNTHIASARTTTHAHAHTRAHTRTQKAGHYSRTARRRSTNQRAQCPPPPSTAHLRIRVDPCRDGRQRQTSQCTHT